MLQSTLVRQRPVRWRRFSGKGYASFQSLHREVVIGVLTAAMLQSSGLLAKSDTLSDGDGHATASLRGDDTAPGDSAAVSLTEVEVLGTRVPLTAAQQPRLVAVVSNQQLSAAAAHSVNDLLRLSSAIDTRQRGELGVQTDISLRGGTFDQVTILLNGVNISSPHTGHLSADFPLSTADVERIEIVEGPAARLFGTSAFTGAVNIVTRAAAAHPSATLNLSAGQYGFADASLALSSTHHLGQRATVAHTLTGGYARADGATPNSFFSRTHFFYHGLLTTGRLRLTAQAGYSYKPYGANTFYGAASSDQWESNERLLAALRAEIKLGSVTLTPTASWNRWWDHYQWHRHVSPGGENFHRVDAAAAGLGAWVVTPVGKTSVGFELRHESILSTSLGTPCAPRPTGGHDADASIDYTRSDSRTNVTAFIDHTVTLGDVTFAAGLLALRNTSLDHRVRLYPGIDASWRTTPVATLFASWNTALRMPTFTDLYYSGANIEGNSQLAPERTSDLAAGLRLRPTALRLTAQAFYSHRSDMIDWVVYEAETRLPDGTQSDPTTWTYRSGNFRLDNYGLSVDAAWLPRERLGERFPLRSLSLGYSYISEHLSHPVAVARSKYAQEYLRHKLVVAADGNLTRRLTLSLSWRWQQREGDGNAPYALLDARLAWAKKHLLIYADCTNLLNRHYCDYGFIPQPGRWIKCGTTLTF